MRADTRAGKPTRHPSDTSFLG